MSQFFAYNADGFILVAFYPADKKKEKAMELNPLVSFSAFCGAV